MKLQPTDNDPSHGDQRAKITDIGRRLPIKLEYKDGETAPEQVKLIAVDLPYFLHN